MQLQYVFGNPVQSNSAKKGKKKKKSKKHKNKVHTRRKKPKIKKVGENKMAKKRRKKKKMAKANPGKGSAAMKRKMAKVRAAKNNPRPKRKNPRYKADKDYPLYYMTASGPKKWNPKGSSKKFKTRQDIESDELESDLHLREAQNSAAQYVGSGDAKSREVRKILEKMGYTPGFMGDAKASIKEAAALLTKIRKEKKNLSDAEAYKEMLEKLGGKVITVDNPKRKKSKKKKAKKAKKAKKPRKAKKAKKSKAKKAKKSKIKKTKRGKSNGSISLYSRKAKKRIKLHIRANPDLMGIAKRLMIPAAITAVGFVAVNSVAIPLIDKYAGKYLPGGSIAGLSVRYVSPLIAPYAPSMVSALIAVGASYLVNKYSKGGQASDVAERGTYGAAEFALTGMMVAILGAYVVPPIAKAAGLSGMEGVKYFPRGMSGADFGMYPQMGQYQQGPGDFGIIPEGLRGVKYFPRAAMGAVEYFPGGGASDSDDMYRQSEHADLMESEGLGMAGPDYGLLPDGMGNDEGQMG